MANEFGRMRDDMQQWIDRQNRTGWASTEVKDAAQFVLMALETCSYAREPVPTICVKILAEYVGKFEAAKARAAGGTAIQ